MGIFLLCVGGFMAGGGNKAAGEYVSRKAGKDKNDKSQRV